MSLLLVLLSNPATIYSCISSEGLLFLSPAILHRCHCIIYRLPLYLPISFYLYSFTSCVPVPPLHAMPLRLRKLKEKGGNEFWFVG